MTTNFIGIPDPVKGDEDSMFATVHALKEAVERDAQGLRTRSLPSADSSRALAGQRARFSTPTATAASLAELRVIVAALQVEVTSNAALIAANAALIATNATDITALDVRVTALEVFHP